jgi:ABC-2 type transport system permease protein
VFAGIGISITILLHGVPFDRNIDVLMMFTMGIGISLFMGTIFFPLYCLLGEERNEAVLVISLLCAIGIIMGITTCINILFGSHMTNMQIIFGAVIIFACASLAFSLSYPLSVAIFKRKEF